MTLAINAAISGFSAATTRIAVSANNIANAQSTQTLDENGNVVNTPYVPEQVNQSTQTTGGVSAQVVPINPPTINYADSNNAAANASGVTQFPNVDTADQLVQAQTATYDAQGNLSVLKVQGDLFQSLLNIIA